MVLSAPVYWVGWRPTLSCSFQGIQGPHGGRQLTGRVCMVCNGSNKSCVITAEQMLWWLLGW